MYDLRRKKFIISPFLNVKILYFSTVIKYNIGVKAKGEEMKETGHQLQDLYELFVKVQTAEDCKALLEDLCTYKEVEQMAQRAYAAKLFLEGKTYNEIIAKTEISSTTLSRVSKAISYGSGGYKKFISTEEKDGQ